MVYDSLMQEIEDEESRASVKEWVQKTFTRRECVKFMPVKSSHDKCGCGRRFDDHKRFMHSSSYTNSVNAGDFKAATAAAEDASKVWRIQENTDTFPTNAFGTLEFQGADVHTKKAEYIRLSFDSKPQNIIKLFKTYWQLELPKLIISVHGGIANFGLQPKLKQAIEKGLIKVANTSQIWIITAGTDTGIVKHIGDILREYFPKTRNNIIAIGIVPWGVISERDSLIGSEIEVPYYANQQGINSGFTLNNCHSYFLLVDDGTVGKYGCEISFRRRLERFLSRHKSEIFVDFDLKPKIVDVTIEEKITLQNHHTIPLVCLVVEGGTNTIQTVLVNVHDKPPVPVVVCDGSGRAADLIAFTHKYATINPLNKRPTMDPDVQDQLISTIMKTFAYKKSQAETLFIQLMNCVTNKDLISIYRLGDEDNQEIDLAILTASLKVIDLHLSKQLEIIMSWNRPDVARKYILLQGTEMEKQILEEKMFDALAEDKVEFVKLLLEYGVNLQKFLTLRRAQDLYNCKKGPSNTLWFIVKDVIKKIDVNHRVSLIDIGLVIEKLIGSGYVSEYSKREFKAKYNKYLLKRNTITSTHNLLTLKDEKERDDVFKYPYNELLIWAVLMKRHKMAMFVCQRGEETLAKALIAAKLNKALAREAELDDLDSEISDEFKRYADDFANLACGLLDKCYKEDDELTSQLLTYDLVNWSHWTCLTLAVSANLKDFLSHAACQLLISDLWMGGMKIRKFVIYKIITALLFPPAIFAIQFKSAKELQYMPQTQEEHEQDLAEQGSSENLSMDANNNELIELNQSVNEKASLSSNDLLHLSTADLFNSSRHLDSKKPDSDAQEDKHKPTEKTYNPISLDQIIEMYDAQNFRPNPPTGSEPKAASSAIHSPCNGTFSEDCRKKSTRFDLPLGHQEKQTMNFQVVKRKSNKLRFGKKIYEFYNAPITKFWQHTIIYIIFLLCFAYIVLVKTPQRPSYPEIFVLVYVFSYGLDKMRELMQTDSPRFSGKVKIFFSKVMNTLDMVFIVTMIVALVFRLAPFAGDIMTPRLLYCVNTIYWIIKLMEFLLINKYTGPLIIIASRMLIDLFNFVVILLILLMCFGLSRQAIKFPDEDFKWDLVKNIFLEPYFMLYGEVYADTIDPPCNMSDPNPSCNTGHWITPLTMTAFLIVANLLFLSILIASFNNTFLRISRQSAQFWKCQRYHFVTAYESKPLLAPPFVILSHVFMVIKYLIRLCQGRKIKFDRKLKSFLSEDMVERLHDFEENCFYQYSCDLEKSRNDQMDEKVNHTRNRVENISARIDDIFFKENMTKLSLYKVELRLQKLEDFTFEAIGHLNNLTSMLRRQSLNLTHQVETQTSQNPTIELPGNEVNLEASPFEIGPLTGSAALRKRTITVCCDDNTTQLSNQMSQRGVRRFDRSLSNISSSQLMFNKSMNASRMRYAKYFRGDVPSEQPDRNRLSVYQDLRSGGAGGVNEPNVSPLSHGKLRKTPAVDQSDAATAAGQEIEEKYLAKCRRNASGGDVQQELHMSSSGSSLDSVDSQLRRRNKRAVRSSSKTRGDDISPEKEAIKLERKTSQRMGKMGSRQSESSSSFKNDRVARPTKSRQSDADSSNAYEMETDEFQAQRIIARYESVPYQNMEEIDPQQQFLMASQQASGFDQYTLHPFVYLHSVVRPPLAEYTSITDCIDTSTIDRPPSPQLSSSLMNSTGMFLNPYNSNKNLASHKLNVNDYCSRESARSIVARQESEILRLAEESQHVIISQMLNKIAKRGENASAMDDDAESTIMHAVAGGAADSSKASTDASGEAKSGEEFAAGKYEFADEEADTTATTEAENDNEVEFFLRNSERVEFEPIESRMLSSSHADLGRQESRKSKKKAVIKMDSKLRPIESQSTICDEPAAVVPGAKTLPVAADPESQASINRSTSSLISASNLSARFQMSETDEVHLNPRSAFRKASFSRQVHEETLPDDSTATKPASSSLSEPEIGPESNSQ